jgi:hypothetical protein
MIEYDVPRYERLLRGVASLSGLYSTNESPYIDSRFVEKLFAETSGGRDLGREDCSFDVVLDGGVGVGVKTFLGGTGHMKREKVAEFTSLARLGRFRTKDVPTLVERVALARNTRILSDVEEYSIELDRSAYHCLIRLPGGAVVHEEPFRLIDIRGLRPTDKRGKKKSSWGSIEEGIYFTDGANHYSYSTSKNVLMKRFEFDRSKNFIDLSIHPRPFDLLLNLVNQDGRRERATISLTSGRRDSDVALNYGKGFIILPLYSTKTGEVPPRSGVNQWNAGGRARRFGEAYIPIPKAIHDQFPHFFPDRGARFYLLLPNGPKVHSAKVCQEGGKALMIDPNFELGRWLLGVIDPALPEAAFQSPAGRRKPYTYSDLVAIGKDSVRIAKKVVDGQTIFSAEFASLGSYEEFNGAE